MAAREAAARGRRRAATVLLWVGIVVVGLLLIINAPPVTRLVLRKALPTLNAQLNGRLAVEGVSGSLLSGLQLRGVTLRDPEGEIVLQAEHVNVRYSVWDLLHSRISLGPILLERPIVRLLKDHPGEQYSLLKVFQKRGNGVDTASKSVDLTIRDLTLREGSVVATVWRQPAAPQRELAQQLDTVQLIGVNLGMPLIHYSAAADMPRAALVQIESASGRLVDPELELYELRGEGQMHGDSITIALSSVRLPHSQLKADAWLVTAPTRRRFDATAHVADLGAGDVKAFIKGATIPADWRFRGDLRTTSLESGPILVQGRNLDLSIAGGSLKGHVTIVGQDNEWSARESRLDVAGVKVERVLRAFHMPSNLRAQIEGYVTAEGRNATADLQVAGVAGYGVHGPIRGHVYASGNLDALSMETQLSGGGIGSLELSGQAATGKHLRLTDLRATLQRFDLAAIDARMPQSQINAQLEGDVVFGSMPREGHLRLFLDSSTIRGVLLDTAVVIASAENGLLTTDTLLARAPGLQMTGAGTFGLTEDQTGDLTLTLDAPSLAEVEPLVAAFTHDTVVNLDGSLRFAVAAKGSIKTYTLGLEAHGHDIAVNGLQVESVDAAASGRPDSLTVNVKAAVDSATALSVGGRSSGKAVAIDSLEVDRGDASWRLQEGARVQMAQGKWTFDSVVLRRDPVPGQLIVVGAWPGAITVSAERLPIADLLKKGNRDSLPDIEARVTYADSSVTGTLALLTTDNRPLTAEFSTKPLRGQVTADSFDLSLLGPLLPSVKKLGGNLNGHVAVEGAIDAPRLQGSLTLQGGTASVPATGVKYHDAYATLTFSGDALQLDSMEVFAGGGRAQFDGRVRFARLDHPELDVRVRTDRFPVLQRRDFLEATATGNLSLTGSPAGARLAGAATVNEGTAFLERFMRSSGIDLSSPLYAQFVDTTVLREAIPSQGLTQALMDSLQIDSLSVDLGDRFWLRSPDASIQLAGRLTVRTPRSPSDTLTVDKYRLVGTVQAVRGIYRMALAPGLTREFTIREGTIRYFGAPKTDAILDLSAEHVVRTAIGDRVTITVHIGGSLAQPTLALTSDVTPPLSETEIISYLVFGAPTAQAFLGEGQASEHHSVFETSAQQLAGVLSGKIESAVQTGLGLPIDYFRIKPGEVQSGLAGTELVLGMQVRILGYPSFLRASPRFCPREQLLSLDHVGINLETRFTPQWGVATSVDPVQGCEAVMSGTAPRPYQFGFDLFWEKR